MTSAITEEHRARRMIMQAEKNTRKPGFACIAWVKLGEGNLGTTMVVYN